LINRPGIDATINRSSGTRSSCLSAARPPKYAPKNPPSLQRKDPAQAALDTNIQVLVIDIAIELF
jgi:hypothetical protein